ncbi:MAG: hypothetical protein ACYC2Y_09665 [Armatimonadota bacterium]
MDTLELLDKLEDLIEGSRHFFNNAFVNIDDFYTLTNKMRASVPEDVKQAARTIREKETIIEEAKDKAARIADEARAEAAGAVEAAKADAQRLVDESEIKRLATMQAKEIVAGAEEEARGTKAGADEYAHEVLADLENFVAKVMSTIQKGRDRLERHGEQE